MDKDKKLLKIADILNSNIYTNDEYIDKWVSMNGKNLLELIVKTNNFTRNNLRNIGDKRWEVVTETYFNSSEYRQLLSLLGDSND